MAVRAPRGVRAADNGHLPPRGAGRDRERERGNRENGAEVGRRRTRRRQAEDNIVEEDEQEEEVEVDEVSIISIKLHTTTFNNIFILIILVLDDFFRYILI